MKALIFRATVLLIFCLSTYLCSAQVTFYSEFNYKGYYMTLKEGNHAKMPPMGKGRLFNKPSNDQISSIKIPAGWKVIVYQHDNFRGKSLTLTKSVPNLNVKRFNNTISSVKITAPQKTNSISSTTNKDKTTASSGQTVKPPPSTKQPTPKERYTEQFLFYSDAGYRGDKITLYAG